MTIMDRRFFTRLVEIHGLQSPIFPRTVDIKAEHESAPVQANGLCGRAIDWRHDTGKYVVYTFDGVHLDVAEDNLKIYEQPAPEEGGFDIGWPYYRQAFFDFCANVNSILGAKGWCLIQLFKSQKSREEALVKAKRQNFEVPKQEFLADLLGRKGKGKVSHINLLDVLDQEAARALGEPKTDFDRYDMDMTSLFAVMGPMTWESMGFHSHGRTGCMVWLPFSGSREESALAPEPLNDDDIDEDGLVEKHIRFLRRRKLCFLYMVDNEGGQITLHPRSDQKSSRVVLPVRRGRLLIFRCDAMTYQYQPLGQHLTLQSWVLEAPPKIDLGEIVANADNLTETLGITSGPVVPQGPRAHIMAGCCLTGGGAWSLEDAGCMYLGGTDAHIYVPKTRFDTDIYFTKDGDRDLIPFQNSYHHHGGLCYDSEVMSFHHDFFGCTEHEASLMQPGQHKTLEVGYETLYRAGWTKKTVCNQKVLVYLGDCGCEWWYKLLARQMQGEHLHAPDGRLGWEEGRSMTVTGQRLSYALGLRGPCWLCDTACSSGLTAFCTAMYSIKKPTERGTASPSVDPHSVGALAGGTNMIIDAGVYLGACGQHMLSLKGRCFTFDVSGDGYARGEGTSMCYVTISDSDRDTELQEACAIGNKVNQDGRSASMTAPNGPSQQMCIKASLREAGVMPHDITASECHGTGTALGDPIEVGSLRGVQETDERDSPVMCTSSKSNIGHLEANAGTTGLFKCILMSKYGVGLPNCHLRQLNPHLDISGWPTYMVNECANYQQQTGLVGVSSFGVSGTNSHAEVWAMCKYGPNAAGRTKLNMGAIKQITVTCPVTLGPIDYLTGEPARADGRKARADCLREDPQYDVSSTVYTGEFRFRREALDDGGDLMNPPGVKVTIFGSWSGWTRFEEMGVEEGGAYTYTVVLGETRCESFVICLDGVLDYCFWPVCNNANQHVWIEGPDPSSRSKGKRWLIDGRDRGVRAGTPYQIAFHWGASRRRVTWQELGAEHAAKAQRHEHRYQIIGSWTSGRMDDLAKSEEEDGVWEYRARIGATGQEEFQLCRDSDQQQLIYPAKPEAIATDVPVCGPDELGAGKLWSVHGPVDEIVKVRMEVADGQIIVAVSSFSLGEKVWESVEGWERHTYWLALHGGPCTPMVMDADIPGLFRGHGFAGHAFHEEHRGFFQCFNIIVDQDHNFGFSPDVAYAGSGECIVWGPAQCPMERPFMAKSWRQSAGFEVLLDLRVTDRRKTVTWAWDSPLQFNVPGSVAITSK
uniref:Type I polyketide synthase n=1 Tax=Gambierdiscus polynesiensis TaxID=439318 RepID=A0A1S6K8B3_9DINO|nr:type I polyketide synthase [Gambierdiscus polynesiensis]